MIDDVIVGVLVVALPVIVGIIVWGNHVETRLSRLEDKIDLIMDYFHLEPNKRR